MMIRIVVSALALLMLPLGASAGSPSTAKPEGSSHQTSSAQEAWWITGPSNFAASDDLPWPPDNGSGLSTPLNVNNPGSSDRGWWNAIRAYIRPANLIMPMKNNSRGGNSVCNMLHPYCCYEPGAGVTRIESCSWDVSEAAGDQDCDIINDGNGNDDDSTCEPSNIYYLEDYETTPWETPFEGINTIPTTLVTFAPGPNECTVPNTTVAEIIDETRTLIDGFFAQPKVRRVNLHMSIGWHQRMGTGVCSDLWEVSCSNCGNTFNDLAAEYGGRVVIQDGPYMQTELDQKTMSGSASLYEMYTAGDTVHENIFGWQLVTIPDMLASIGYPVTDHAPSHPLPVVDSKTDTTATISLAAPITDPDGDTLTCLLWAHETDTDWLGSYYGADRVHNGYNVCKQRNGGTPCAGCGDEQSDTDCNTGGPYTDAHAAYWLTPTDAPVVPDCSSDGEACMPDFFEIACDGSTPRTIHGLAPNTSYRLLAIAWPTLVPGRVDRGILPSQINDFVTFTTNESGASVLTGDLIASTTSCAAPCFVHFDATGTTHTDVDVRPFHDLHYKIDYGDSACASGQGTWPNSDSDAPRNSDLTPIGAHVYECAGALTATLTVTDSAGNTDTDTVNLTVTAEGTEWADADTTCVSTDGTFTGCTGTTQTTSSDFDSSLNKSAGKRTLYRCGQTFVIDANPDLSSASGNRSLVGGYGSCSGNPAIVTYAGTGDLLNDADLDGWTFRDITFSASAATYTTSFLNNFQAEPTINDLLLLRVGTLNVGECAAINTVANSSTWNDRIAFFSYTCTQTVDDPPPFVGYYIGRYASGRNNAFVDDNITLSGVHMAMARLMGFEKLLWAHGSFTAGPGALMTIQFRSADGDDSTRDDNHNVISDWRIHDDGSETGRNIAMCWGPACQNDANNDLDKADFIFEGIRTTYGTAKLRTAEVFQLAGTRITVRNNVLDMRGKDFDGNVFFASDTGAFGPDTVDYDAYNNTIIRGGSHTGETYACNMTGAAATGRCRNNLIYDVADTDTSTTIGSGYEVGGDTNNLHLQQSGECPFAGSDDACTLTASSSAMDFDEFKIRSAGGGRASVVDAGFDFPEATVGQSAVVYCDAYGMSRGTALGGSDAQWDIGAHESGAVVACDD